MLDPDRNRDSPSMKILVVHNIYQIPGGEETTFYNEVENLRAHGHEVITYTRENAEVTSLGAVGRLTMPLEMTWSRRTYNDLRDLVRQHHPDIAHIHNTHFMISPAAVHACADAGVPVVVTLHNFRLICPAATLFRDGAVCEACVGRAVPLPGVVHGCFRSSRAHSALLTANIAFHNARHTWDRVAQFITPTAFVRQKMIAGGLPGSRITAKPHFLPKDPGHDDTPRERFLLYVGRFTAEKGTGVLLDAWRTLPDIPLKVVGEGPLMAAAAALLADNPGLPVTLLGRQPNAAVLDLMRRAHALVFPSEVYETFGIVIVEAFAVGTPVIASGHGAPAELIADGETGWHFAPGDPAALAATVRRAWDADVTHQRAAARTAYTTHYTAERNYALLMDIYERAREAIPA